MDIAESRKLIGNSKTLQGNLDPCALYGTFDEIKKQTRSMMQQFGNQKYIANLGHGIIPNVPVDNARAFVDAVKEYKV